MARVLTKVNSTTKHLKGNSYIIYFENPAVDGLRST